MLVVGDIKTWWEKKGITLRTPTRIREMTISIVSDYNLRKKNQKKMTDNEVKKRNELVKTSKTTFWVVSPEYENELKESTDSQDISD